MILIVGELRTEIANSFSLLNDTRYIIEQVSINLYMHNSPAGTFAVDIMSGADTVETREFTSSDIKEAYETTNDYIHGFFPITFNTKLTRGIYSLRLRPASGYTYDGDSFLSWKKDWDGFYLPEFAEREQDYPYSFRLVTKNDY